MLRQALAAGYDVSVLVRNPDRLPADVRDRVSIGTRDLRRPIPPELIDGHDALINCAGHVSSGPWFVELVERVIAAVESLHATERPVCWFLAGAALLDIDASGRRGVDVPELHATYWPHLANFERLKRSGLDWRLLCPGPMSDRPALGLERLSVSLDRLPLEVPALVRAVPDPLALPVLMPLIRRMSVPYADAAALMLANLDRGSALSRHRVGLGPRP